MSKQYRGGNANTQHKHTNCFNTEILIITTIKTLRAIRIISNLYLKTKQNKKLTSFSRAKKSQGLDRTTMTSITEGRKVKIGIQRTSLRLTFPSDE